MEAGTRGASAEGDSVAVHHGLSARCVHALAGAVLPRAAAAPGASRRQQKRGKQRVRSVC